MKLVSKNNLKREIAEPCFKENIIFGFLEWYMCTCTSHQWKKMRKDNCKQSLPTNQESVLNNGHSDPQQTKQLNLYSISLLLYRVFEA